MTTTAWTHLPNAAHIDRVLAHAKATPNKWSAARGTAYSAAYEAALLLAVGGVTFALCGETYRASSVAVISAGSRALRAIARDAVCNTALALIAWDDCAYILDMPVAAVRLLAACDNHAAALLLPAVIAMTGEPECTT